MPEGFIPPHGGYQSLLSYQRAEVVYDATVKFCADLLDRRDRTVDQMVQAARSGKQNIVEGSMASGTSRETEIKLTLPDSPDQLPARPAIAAAGKGFCGTGRPARKHDPRPARTPR
jgi:hypothetical protein